MVTAEKPKKEGKSIFEGGVKNEENLYTEAPTDFDFTKFKPLSKGDFHGDEIYLDHQGNICAAKATIFQDKADRCRNQADKLRQLGDPDTRKRAMKLQKMRESLKALEAQLVEDGVDLDILA